MNRNDLVTRVTEATGLSSRDAAAAVAATLDEIVAGVAAGDTVTLPGFGTFDRRERSARTGRNPQTGETMEIAASVAPGFKPAAAFKRAVAGG